MSFILLILLLNLFVNAVRSGYVGIRIIKNEDGFETPVKSWVKTKSGASFSLNCKAVGTKGEKLFYDNIVWGRKIGQLKFNDKYMIMENNVTNDANLKFTSVTVNDQGDYFCAIPIHKLFKTVSVIVKPGLEATVPVVRKRSFVDNYAKERHSIRKRGHPDWLKNLEQHIRDEEEQRERERQEEYRKKPEKKEAARRKTDSIRIIGAVLVGTVIIIGILFCVLRKHVIAKLKRWREMRAAENLTMATRPLQEEAVNMHQQISPRGSEELHSNDHGSARMERPHANFVPDLYDDSNSRDIHDLPVPNLRGNELKNSYSYDLLPTYEQAVVDPRPSAPPTVGTLMSATTAPKYKDGT